MLHALAYTLAAIVQAVVFLWKLRDLVRDPSDPRLRAITLALFTTGVGFNFAVPSTYAWIGQLTGVPNIATLIVYCSIATTVMMLQIFASHLARDDQDAAPVASRLLIVGTAAAIIAMIALFARAPIHADPPRPLNFDATYATEPTVVCFLAVFWSAYTTGLVRNAWVCRRVIPYARARPWLRRGVALVVIGTPIAVLYAVLKAVSVAAAWLGVDLTVVNVLIAPACATLGAAAIAIGFVLPTLPRVGQRRQTQRLRPLLRALRPLAPELTRFAPLSTHRDRTLVVVLDLLRRLRNYLSPQARALAEAHADQQGLPADSPQRAAAVEAARIAAGLAAYRRGEKTGDGWAMIREDTGLTMPPEGVSVAPHIPHPVPDRTLATAELHELALIADALAAPHPVVTAVLRDLERHHAQADPTA